MSDATALPTPIGTSVNPKEAAHFGGLARDWWDPRGSSAMLHRLNPPRLRYIRDAADAHWGLDAAGFTPLAGKRALDMGCGAGLLSEPLARMGAAVTGVDAAAENIAVARLHGEAGGLAIDYRTGGVEVVADERFDLVVSLEVIEHVDDQQRFVDGLARALAEGGLMILSTPNRTAWSRLTVATLAEMTGAIPRGTHDWHRFLTPDEITAMLVLAGLRVTDVTGLGFSPATGFTLTDSTALDYFVTATRA